MNTEAMDNRAGFFGKGIWRPNRVIIYLGMKKNGANENYKLSAYYYNQAGQIFSRLLGNNPNYTMNFMV